MVSPLKWAGGKRWQVELVQALYSAWNCSRLIEPFCGSASVTFGVAPLQATLADAQPHLINFFQRWQDGLQLSELQTNPQHYRLQRLNFNALIDLGKALTPEGAGLFYYLNKAGFNGLCRFNRQGHFNVPAGSAVVIPPLTAWPLLPYAFVRQHYAETLSHSYGQHALIYADPPYDDAWTDYTDTPFTWNDQALLAETLARQEGPVIATNHATPRILELYRDLKFHDYRIQAPRRIAASGDREPVFELFATNRPVDPAIRSRFGLTCA